MVAEGQAVDDVVELSVDELAGRVGVPVRTIREYQTVGVLPAPQRRGRVGVYGASHVARLHLIARLQQRGYSLAGIRDLLGSWRDGADLGDVLGLEPDQLVHLDEPGAPATLAQLTVLLPAFMPERLDDLLAVGLIADCAPGRYCIPSPSLLQLTIDALAAGYQPNAVLTLLATVHASTAAIAGAVVDLLANAPAGADAADIDALTTKGRGLLAHGTGRQTILAIGRQLGIDDTNDAATAAARTKTRKARR